MPDAARRWCACTAATVRHRRRAAPPSSPLCTVPSSIAVQWVIDHVIVPAVRGGLRSPPATVAAGVGLIIGIGVLRAAGVVDAAHVGRHDAVAGRRHARPRRRRPPRAPADVVAPTAAPTATSSPAPASTPTPRSPCSRRSRSPPGTVLLIVVSAVWLLATDLVLGARRGRRVPAADRPQRRLPAARRSLLRRRPRTQLGALSAGVHESFEGVQLVKAYGAEAPRDRAAVDDRRPAARRPDQAPSRLRGTFEALLDVLPSLTNVGLVVLGAHRVDSGRRHRRRAVELHLPVHAARVPAAPDRLRAVRAAALAGRLAARPRACSTSRSSPTRGTPSAVAAPGSGLAARRRRVHVRRRRPQPALARRRPRRRRRVASSPSSGRPAPARRTLVELVGGLVAPDVGHGRASAAGARAIVFQEAFLFAGTIRDNLVLGADARRRRACGRRCAWRAPSDFVAELAARPRHGGRRARRQPERRPAPAHRPGAGAGAPPGAAAARRHDVGARPGHRGGACSATCAARSPARPC